MNVNYDRLTDFEREHLPKWMIQRIEEAKVIPMSEWRWFGHPAHLIVGNDCRFHLATLIGDVLVSTVGEYLPDSQVRETLAESRGVALEGRGDDRRHDYMRKIGYEENTEHHRLEGPVGPDSRGKSVPIRSVAAVCRASTRPTSTLMATTTPEMPPEDTTRCVKSGRRRTRGGEHHASHLVLVRALPP